MKWRVRSYICEYCFSHFLYDCGNGYSNVRKASLKICFLSVCISHILALSRIVVLVPLNIQKVISKNTIYSHRFLASCPFREITVLFATGSLDIENGRLKSRDQIRNGTEVSNKDKDNMKMLRLLRRALLSIGNLLNCTVQHLMIFSHRIIHHCLFSREG